MATIKGQNLRILVGTAVNNRKCIAASTSCTLHLSAVVGEKSTKDSDNDWIEQEITGLAWDVQTEALITTGGDAGAVDVDELVVGNVYRVLFSPTNGSQNRNTTGLISRIQCYGKAILSDLTLVATDRDNSTWSATFTGTEDLTRPQ
jgi:hypothetical protein